MEVVKFIYHQQQVDFLPTQKNEVMVNATQMANIIGKEVYDFLKNDGTKSFIQSCLKTENSRFLGIENENDLVNSKQKSGTWMHRVLALKFAAWLDPDFDLWVYITIDKILNQHVKEQREAIRKKLELKIEKDNKKNELLSKYPEMASYFELETKEKQAHKAQIAAVKQQVMQLKLEFEEMEAT